MKKLLLLIIVASMSNLGNSQEFFIIKKNTAKRGYVTHSINSGGFIVGINSFGGGYITQIEMPGLGNIMGFQAQRYGRGGQSSIRDMGRGGQCNPTQAGYSDLLGTECAITTVSSSKLVIPSRGCAFYNGDGGYDYTEWENIGADPYKTDGGNTDIDNITESNPAISVTINGKTFGRQQAEVYSNFDYYGEYEDYTTKVGLAIPAIRHYLEYRFVRSSIGPNSGMKQFNEQGLKAAGKWNDSKFLSDISVENPVGVHPGGLDNMNSIILSWSIRNDVATWNPGYRYQQKQNGDWEIKDRQKQFQGKIEQLKLRFIVADSNDENSGNALGFYLPLSYLNEFNVVGIKESDNSEVYVDNRTTSDFYLDGQYRTPSMSWIGFRSELNGLIDRSKLTGQYAGVYEKLRQESILLHGTPAEIKAAFTQLDTYYASLLSASDFEYKNKDDFQLFPNPAEDQINIVLNNTNNNSKISVFNALGALVYSSNEIIGNKISIPTNQIGATGLYFVKVGTLTKKLILK
ncbi:Por secretion system C-terminal sorting domain-containing protein [Algibacter lectus]|uniref:T9SS type A sorting domain-containing protein n=1 Tax=Algibacter lectus TaxID=221126 RepID=UPI0008EF92F9|nr:T9SS type A sorting domain-containing protein [Algibacter lectus]SFB95639.1 Por secretion system C-terminal sorting domain-containing protein [Algibacter lectus]